MTLHTTAERNYLTKVRAAGEQLAEAIEERRGFGVPYGYIGLNLPPNTKAYVTAATLGEYVMASPELGAFGFGRFLAKSSMVPFEIFEVEGSNNTPDLLEQLLFMQMGSLAAFKSSLADKASLLHSHTMLCGFIYEATENKSVAYAKMPGGKDMWLTHKRNLIAAVEKFLPALVDSCAQAEAALEASCETGSPLGCTVLIDKLKQEVTGQTARFSALVERAASHGTQTQSDQTTTGGFIPGVSL